MIRVFRSRQLIRLGLILLSLHQAPVTANAFFVGAEIFRWQEFDSSGTRLLGEDGLRYSLGLELRDLPSPFKRARTAVNIKLYNGDINYNGQDQCDDPPICVRGVDDGNYVQTITDYSGWATEAAAAVPMSNNNQALFTLAIGADAWDRALRPGVNALGDPISGVTEKYLIGYSRTGIRLPRQYGSWSSELNLGLKYPFYTREEASGLVFRPEKRLSLYADYRLMLNPENSQYFYIVLYYDSLRFDASPLVSGYLQPESNLDTYGISIGVPF